MRNNRIRKLAVAFLLPLTTLAVGCAPSTSSNETSTTLVGQTTTTTIAKTGEPVADFLSLAKELNAIDRSFLSVDQRGTFGVLVTDRFKLYRFTVNGWFDMTAETPMTESTDGKQLIEDMPVEKTISVTTRDFTGDRENDFLIRFGSKFKEYGAILNSRDGAWEFKPFCLIYPSKDRPGKTRTAVVEDLYYSDEYQAIEGQDYGSDGSSVGSYWRWSKKNHCFADTANR